MLRVSEIDAYHGQSQALFNLSMEVEEGEVVALLGRNGAGKTTTFKTIMGLVPTARGKIAFRGRSIHGRAPHVVARRGIGYVPAERRIFTGLTVSQNLAIARQGRRRDTPAWPASRLFELFPSLAKLRGRLGGEISGGEQKVLALARALAGNPRLLLLDEPSEGLSPMMLDSMLEVIVLLKQEGVTVVMADQNLGFAAEVAERAYIIDRGTMKVQERMEDLLRQETVLEKYLAA